MNRPDDPMSEPWVQRVRWRQPTCQGSIDRVKTPDTFGFLQVAASTGDGRVIIHQIYLFLMISRIR